MTTQELPERRPPKIDLNLLPAEYLPKKKSPWGLVLVLAVVVLACVPWPFLIMKADVDAENRRLESELQGLKSEMSVRQGLMAEAAGLQKQVADLQDQWDAMQSDWDEFEASLRTWSEIMFDVQQLPRGALGELDNIGQNGDTISIDGWFSRSEFVYEYSLMLSDTGHFEEVTIKQTIYGSEAYKFKIEAILVPVVPEGVE